MAYPTETSRQPVGSAGELELWSADMAQAERRGADLYPLLSEDERERAARFHGKQQRARFIYGRALLRMLLGHYTGSAPARLRFNYGAKGKPVLLVEDGVAACYFNLAHSGERLLIALTTVGEIGVDIEALSARFDLEDMARRICTPRERARWLALPCARRAPALLACWTRKEAYLKGVGCGLEQRLTELDVSGAQPRGAACADTWYLHDVDLGDEYVAAVAVAGKIGSQPQVRDCSELDRQSSLHRAFPDRF